MRLIASIAAAVMVLAAFSANALADENTVLMETSQGNVVIQLRPDLAPKHVEQIKTLVKDGFYDGIVFHRVIDGFMAQTGDPTGTGMRRFESAGPSGRVHRYAVCARRARHGPHAGSEHGQFPVLHHVRRRVAISTASTRSWAKSPRAWKRSTRSRRAIRQAAAWSTDRTRSSRCRCRTPADNVPAQQ